MTWFSPRTRGALTTARPPEPDKRSLPTSSRGPRDATSLLDEAWVYVPDLAYDECGCPRHAARLLITDTDTYLTKVSSTARAALAVLLPDHPPARRARL